MKYVAFAILALVALSAVACAAPTPAAPPPTAPPQIVKETVVITVAGTPQVQVVEKVVTATPVPPTAVPTKAPVGPKDTIVLALSQEPDTLFPNIGSMMARTLVLNGGIFSACTLQDEKAAWVAVLCESVPTLENGGAKFVGEGVDKHLEATFKYKAGLKWHDGTPTKASDQVYGWKLVMDPDFPMADRTFVYKIYKVEAVDDLTWKASWMSEKQALEAAAGTLKGDVNFAAFKADYGPDGLGFDQWKGRGPVVDAVFYGFADFAYPEHLLGKLKAADMEKSEFASKPVGNGPYKLKEWAPAQQIVLEAVPDHPLKPKIKTIIFRFITDASAELAALQNGEIEGATQIGLEVDSSPELDKLDKGTWRVDYTPGYQWEHIDLNTTAFPFDDIKVRQALAYATNKKAVVDKLYYGKVKIANSWLPDFHWAYDDTAITKYEYNPDKAKALLAEAGWDCKALPCVNKDKKKLEFTLQTTDRKDRQALAQVLQAQWKAVGFGANLQFLYGRGLFATCTGGAGGPLNCRTFQAGMYTWLAGDDPDVSTTYTCKSTPSKDNGWSGQNYPGICDKKLDELLVTGSADAEIAISQVKRKPIYVEAQKIWTSLVPVIPIKANANVTVWNVHLKGATGVPTNSGETWNMWAWEWVP
jgi:peptide/nickel transport system substrate-binding protein